MRSLIFLQQLTVLLAVVSIASLLVLTMVQLEVATWIYGISTAFGAVIGLGSLTLIAYGRLRRYEMGSVWKTATILFVATSMLAGGACFRTMSLWK